MIVKKNNFNRFRVYEELRIPFIEEWAKFIGTKSFLRWSRSSKIMRDLIDNIVYLHERNNPRRIFRSWVNVTHEFIKKNRVLERMEDTPVLRKVIQNTFIAKPKFCPENKLNQLAERLKFGDRIRVLTSELSFNKQEIFRAISRARTGTLWLHNDLVRKNMVIEGRIGLCLSCLEPHEESLVHLLLRCTRFEESREKNLNPILRFLNSQIPNREECEEALLSITLFGKLYKYSSKKMQSQIETKVLMF